MAQVALAWVSMNRDGVIFYRLVSSCLNHLFMTGVTAPIIGTSSLENLHDLLGPLNERGFLC